MMTSIGLFVGGIDQPLPNPVMLECLLGETGRHGQDCTSDQTGHSNLT